MGDGALVLIKSYGEIEINFTRFWHLGYIYHITLIAPEHMPIILILRNQKPDMSAAIAAHGNDAPKRRNF